MQTDSSGTPPQRPDVRIFDPSEEEPPVYGPCEDIPVAKKRARKKLPNFLRWHQAMKLLDWCVAQIELHRGKKIRAYMSARRDEMIIRTGLFLGLRLAEISNLEVTDIDLERQAALVRQGKGNKDRCVRIGDTLVPHLRSWIGDRKEGILISGPRGRVMAPTTVRFRLKRAARLSGIHVHVHPHLLRHTYATRLLETGTNIRSVQALLGHADLATTAVYLDVDVSRFADDVNRMG